MARSVDPEIVSAQPPARCGSPAARHALLEHAFALGVPRNHARARHLRLQREPARLVSIGTDVYGRTQWLQPRAAGALANLRQAARRDGVVLEIVSAFRSVEYQLGILQRKLARGQSMDAILRVSAAPGYSEHHTGRCVDFTTPAFAPLEEVFDQSSAFAWLMQRAAAFGFALSYPRNNPHAMAYEPWHWCWHAQRAVH
jgi:D-alanyl-D-alanine carboxypeptidase